MKTCQDKKHTRQESSGTVQSARHKVRRQKKRTQIIENTWKLHKDTRPWTRYLSERDEESLHIHKIISRSCVYPRTHDAWFTLAFASQTRGLLSQSFKSKNVWVCIYSCKVRSLEDCQLPDFVIISTKYKCTTNLLNFFILF